MADGRARVNRVQNDHVCPACGGDGLARSTEIWMNDDGAQLVEPNVAIGDECWRCDGSGYIDHEEAAR